MRVFESFVVVVFETGDNSGNSITSSSSSSSSLSNDMLVNVRSIPHPTPCSSLLSLLPCHEPSRLGADSPAHHRTTLTYGLTCTPGLCSTPLSVVVCGHQSRFGLKCTDFGVIMKTPRPVQSTGPLVVPDESIYQASWIAQIAPKCFL